MRLEPPVIINPRIPTQAIVEAMFSNATEDNYAMVRDAQENGTRFTLGQHSGIYTSIHLNGDLWALVPTNALVEVSE